MMSVPEVFQVLNIHIRQKTVNASMKIARNLADLKNYRRELDGRVGFVPTMGALHQGHLSLIDVARVHCDSVIVSIFVNPTQFAPHEDFDSYPRDEKKDADLLQTKGIDVLFLPTEGDLYPSGKENPLHTGEAAKGLESNFRPHFFGGVTNVVHRLFDAVQPDIAVFGEKDYQQLMVIREMVRDYDLNIDIIGAPVARDACGLALSSRNAYLSSDEVQIARKLNQIIREDIGVSEMKSELLKAGFDKVDYVEKRWNRVLAAVWLRKTRLIDNVAC